MKKTIIIAHDTQGNTIFVNIYELTHECSTDEEALGALREQLKAWAKTEDGQEANEEATDDFNWGDLGSWIEELELKSPLIDITESWNGSGLSVEHDELLLEE